MTWALASLEDARSQLGYSIANRLAVGPVPATGRVRLPLAFAWVRGDRGGAGQELGESVAASYGYWNQQTGQYFDIVFFGWMTDGPDESAPHHGMYFDVAAFSDVQAEVETLTKWRYSGETDFLLLDWEHDLDNRRGDFAFDRTVPLQIEELIRQNKVGSLDSFVQDLVNKARDVWPPGAESPTWDIGSRMALSAGRRTLWEWVSKAFLRDLGRIYDGMKPFAICDIRQVEQPT
jgi:hypothetical protein